MSRTTPLPCQSHTIDRPPPAGHHPPWAVLRASLFLLLLGWGTLACAGAMPESVEVTMEAAEPAGEEAPAIVATPPATLQSPGEALPETPAAAPTPQTISLLPENRLLTFEWPSEIRQGDSDVVRLSLVVDEAGNLTPTAAFAGHEVQGERVQIENLYDSHVIRAEARLDLAGLEVIPDGTQDQQVSPGLPVEFSWSVKPTASGTYRGSVWLTLRYIPKETGEPLEKLLFNHPFEIQATNLLGLGGTPARVLGAIGSVIGSLLGLDDLLAWLRRWRRGSSS